MGPTIKCSRGSNLVFVTVFGIFRVKILTVDLLYLVGLSAEPKVTKRGDDLLLDPSAAADRRIRRRIFVRRKSAEKFTARRISRHILLAENPPQICFAAEFFSLLSLFSIMRCLFFCIFSQSAFLLNGNTCCFCCVCTVAVRVLVFFNNLYVPKLQ